MSDRDQSRFDTASDAHLADRAAYGDERAFSALAARFGDRLWATAVLASGDTATATRATARAFTRTLAEQAAGIRDLDDAVAPSLVASAYELALGESAAPDTERQPAALPTALVALDPWSRVALWLVEGQGWAVADAAEALGADDVDAVRARLAALAGDAEVVAAARSLALTAPPAAHEAAAASWHEWQDIGLTIPDRHPLTVALSRLDAPLARVGDALGHAGERATRAVRHRRTRRGAAATPTRAPAPLSLPVGPTPRRAALTLALTGPAPLATFSVAPTPRERPAAAAAPAAPVAARPSDDEGGADRREAAMAVFLGGRRSDEPDLDRQQRRREVVLAGTTPTRTRVLAALTAGILTAAAMGSLATSDPGSTPTRDPQVAAGAPATGSDGALLDDPTAPPQPISEESPAPTTTAPADDPGGNPGGADRSGDGSGSLLGPTGGPSGSDGGSGSPAGGSGGGSGGPSGGPTPTAPAATPTTQAPAPTTQPPPPTTQPPPPTTQPPPPTTQPGPVCTLLPILCPGGGLVP